MVLEISAGFSRVRPSPVLMVDSLDLSLRLANLESLINAFKDTGSSPAGQFVAGSDLVTVGGIIRFDLFYLLGPLQLVPCLRSWAFSIPAGLVPFGEVDSIFLLSPPPHHEIAHLSFNSVLEHAPQVDSSRMCFVLVT